MKSLIRFRKDMKLSSDCPGKKDYITLCSLFEFPLFTPGVLQRSKTSSDVMLALTTWVLARKWDWDQITGWVAVLCYRAEPAVYPPILQVSLITPPKFVPVCPLSSHSPMSIQTFSNSCLSLYLIFSTSFPFYVDFLFALWYFSKGGSLYVPSSPL